MTPGATSGRSRFNNNNNNNNQQYPQQQQQRYQVEVQTPVVSAYNNSYNLSTIGNNTNTSSSNASALMGSAWTADEHHRFLDGLEKYGGSSQSQTATSAQNVWQSITSAVRTRSLQEVKVHANRYFLELQLVDTQKRKEHLMMQTIDSRWTLEEDAQFEHLLAFHASRDDLVCYPWEQIAARLLNKSPRDVQERYHKLCYDVSRIEAGHHVMMSFGRFSRNTKATISGISAVHPVSAYSIAAAQHHQQQPGDIGRSSREQDSDESALGPIDCVVTLTVDEEAILMKALEQVHVSPNAPPQVLTGIASAIAAIANSRTKKPPQRAQPLFTLEEARTVFDQIINDQYYHQQQQQQYIDPRAVLEELVHKLRLQPRDQDPGRRSSERVGFEAAAHKLKPLATAGLAFTDDGAPPTPSLPKFGALRGCEDRRFSAWRCRRRPLELPSSLEPSRQWRRILSVPFDAIESHAVLAVEQLVFEFAAAAVSVSTLCALHAS